MRSRLKTFLLILVLLASCTPTATSTRGLEQENTATPLPRPEGDTITVTNSSNSGPGSLRQALSDAQDGDTVTFDPAVFRPDAPETIFVTGEELPAIGMNYLTLDASNAGVVLDGNQLEGEWIAGLQIVSSEGSTIMAGRKFAANNIGDICTS